MSSNLRIITEALINTNPDKKDISLATGNSGRILFLATYYIQTRDETCQEKIEELLEENFETLNREPASTSFHNGLAGYGWLLQHLAENHLLDPDDLIDILAQFDDVITGEIHQKISTLKDLTTFNTEIFQTCHYLFQRLKKSGNIKSLLTEVVNNLENMISAFLKTEHLSFQWPTIPEIILFLSKCIRAGIQKKKSKELIELLLNNISLSVPEFIDKNTFFPAKNTGNNRIISLDLNMACALWEAGKTCDNTHWTRLAYIILKYNAYNKDKNHNFFYKKGIAEDNWAIAYLYQYFYKKTGFKLFEKNSSFWLETKLLPTINSKYSTLGMQNGLSGIGLALMPVEEKLIGIL
ncbi:lanthionine synthetase LanC family protein [Sinomicrobium sp. M5D2P9]